MRNDRYSRSSQENILLGEVALTIISFFAAALLVEYTVYVSIFASISVVVVAVVAMRKGGPVKNRLIRITLLIMIALNTVLLLINTGVVDAMLEVLPYW
jgi:hypothetical protein